MKSRIFQTHSQRVRKVKKLPRMRFPFSVKQQGGRPVSCRYARHGACLTEVSRRSMARPPKMPRSAQTADATWRYEDILVGSTVIHRISSWNHGFFKAILEYDKVSMIRWFECPAGLRFCSPGKKKWKKKQLNPGWFIASWTTNMGDLKKIPN